MPCRTMWWLILWMLTLHIGSVARRRPPSYSPSWYKYLRAAPGEICFPTGRFCITGGRFFVSEFMALITSGNLFTHSLLRFVRIFQFLYILITKEPFCQCLVEPLNQSLASVDLLLAPLILTLCFAISCVTEPINSLPGSTCSNFG